MVVNADLVRGSAAAGHFLAARHPAWVVPGRSRGTRDVAWIGALTIGVLDCIRGER
jgi:hypothetical protein